MSCCAIRSPATQSSTFQSEWATDVVFRDAPTLGRLYPSLVHHGLTTFFSPDILRFLGRHVPASGALPAGLKAEVTNDIKTRTEGVRIKHRVGANSIKMYDKQGSLLRVETTINDVTGFKSFRSPQGQPKVEKDWRPMRRGIADLHRRAEISHAANHRYFQAMASVENTTPLGQLVDRLCRPLVRNGRRVRALNPYAHDDAKLIEAIGRGEFTIAGFRNRDLRALLFTNAGASKKNSGASIQETRPAARPRPDQESPGHASLPPHQRRPDHGHCPHHRTQRHHGFVNKISRLDKSVARREDSWGQ
jgi:hypothetical protein